MLGKAATSPSLEGMVLYEEMNLIIYLTLAVSYLSFCDYLSTQICC